MMGFATRTREEDDRRVVTTRITPAGLKAIEPLDEVILQAHRGQLGHLGPEKLKSLIELTETREGSLFVRYLSRSSEIGSPLRARRS